MPTKGGATVIGSAGLVRINLVILGGLLALVSAAGGAGSFLLTYPALAAVCGVLLAGLLLIGAVEE